MKDNLEDEWFSPIILSCNNMGMEKSVSRVFPQLEFCQGVEHNHPTPPKKEAKLMKNFLDSDYNEEWTLSWKQREQEEKAQSIWFNKPMFENLLLKFFNIT